MYKFFKSSAFDECIKKRDHRLLIIFRQIIDCLVLVQKFLIFFLKSFSFAGKSADKAVCSFLMATSGNYHKAGHNKIKPIFSLLIE